MLSKQIRKLFFQWSPQVYSVPGQAEGRKKAFLELTSIDLFSKLSITCGGNVNYCKSVHHPIHTVPVGIGNTLAIFKTKQKTLLSVECPGIFSSWPNWRGEEGLFWGCRKGAALWDYHQEHLVVIRDEKVCPFVKSEIILPLRCFLWDPLTNKHCRARNFLINLWTCRFQDLSKVQNATVSKVKV